MGFKGSDRQCMVVKLSMQSCRYCIRIHLRHIQCFHGVKLLSLSAKSTFKIIHLSGYVLRNDLKKKSLILILKTTDSENVPTQIHHFEHRFCSQTQ